MAVSRQDSQLGCLDGSVRDAGGLDGAEHVAVAGEDQRRGGDVGEVFDGVSERGDVAVEEQAEIRAAVTLALGFVVVGPSS